MNYAKITYPDLNNGTGCRVTLWLSGCRHKCQGCHNKDLWNPMYGREFTLDTYNKLKQILELPYIDGITLSGGDPLYDTIWTQVFCRRLKKDFPDKTIWLYTGYTFDNIDPELKEVVDVIVDGPYIEEQRDITLAFRGSKNQRIIPCK